MSPTKTKLTTADQGVNYLGYRLNRYKGKLYAVIPRDRVNRFKDRVRELTRRGSHIKWEDRVVRLGYYVGGWGEYFKRADQPDLLYHLDRWIYRRVIAMIAGRWRTWVFKKYPLQYFREEMDLPSLYWMRRNHFEKLRMLKKEVRATSLCRA